MHQANWHFGQEITDSVPWILAHYFVTQRIAQDLRKKVGCIVTVIISQFLELQRLFHN